jgi:hypothetical protein
MFLLCSPVMGQQAKTFFEPDNQKVKLGNKFQTQIVFYTGNEPISAFDIHLKFDPEILKVISVKTLQSDLFSYHRPFNYDNKIGRIDASAYQLNKTVPTEKFAIAEIEFVAISVAKTTVEHILDDFPKTIMAYGGVNMLRDAMDFEVIVEGEMLTDNLRKKESELGLEIWPNPSSTTSTIRFDIPTEGRAKLGLYDMKGNLISEVFEGDVPAGAPYQLQVNLENLSNGVYACRLITKELFQSKMLVVTK